MDLVSVKAKIGQSGLDLDKREAMYPRLVYTKIASTPSLLAAVVNSGNSRHQPNFSARLPCSTQAVNYEASILTHLRSRVADIL